ncbi:toxin RelE [Bifidobacterium dolichotidis]|uniref:Toxin RelE n=1 Tax=Bifidobacterium dolichotidis TaxID=2306976 RepID=A0A430FRY7_9BIFI|nr:type II toxin-antitoxin system RelE/ParE family toxin [Bifidobacterium dolichotidis]RSX55615.1 toxin RelE [Bifidobacterium dolichotidis]
MCKLDLSRIQDWLDSLDEDSRNRVDMALHELALQGPQLRMPLVKLIEGSTTHALKELRIAKYHGHIYRILFCFGPDREAVMLVAGDKASHGMKHWYEWSIPVAEEMIQQLKDPAHCGLMLGS